jgi:ABC-type transporter Mla subunit MlaD
MNDDQLDDLKQFIAASISQSEARMTACIDGLETKVGGLEQKIGGLTQRFDRLEKKVDSLEQKIDDGFAGIAEALEINIDRIDERQDRFDKTLKKPERQVA